MSPEVVESVWFWKVPGGRPSSHFHLVWLPFARGSLLVSVEFKEVVVLGLWNDDREITLKSR